MTRALTTTAAILPQQPQPKPRAKRIRWRLWPKRKEASTYQRALFAHIVNCQPGSALK